MFSRLKKKRKKSVPLFVLDSCIYFEASKNNRKHLLAYCLPTELLYDKVILFQKFQIISAFAHLKLRHNIFFVSFQTNRFKSDSSRCTLK